MSLPRLHLTVLLSFLLPATAIVSQQPQTPAQPAPTAPPKTGRVFLDVVVASNAGVPLGGLQQQDFTVLDNKVARPITAFHAVGPNEVPAEALIVIDAVNTPVAEIGAARIQVEKFLRANGGRLSVPISLVFFTNTGTRVEPLSRDGNKLADTLEHAVIDFRTNVPIQSHEAEEERLETSVQTLKGLLAREMPLPGRKLILWISPGWPLLWAPGSADLSLQTRTPIFTSVVGLSQELRDGRYTLYAINPLDPDENVARAFFYEDFLKGVPSASKTMPGNVGLQVLALQSGGLVLHGSADIAGELQHCIGDTTAYYGISFDVPPAAHPNEYHQIDIQIAKPGLIARARQGYYDQP